MTLVKIKTIALLGLMLGISYLSYAQTYIGKGLKVSLFSSTPIEDIRASSNAANAVMLLPKQELNIQIPIKSFEFEKKLMQEHFNENYMESDKYPIAKFKGSIEPLIDWTKDGDYTVSAKGILSVHGVDVARTIAGKINIKNGVISISSNFDVTCAVHHIEIPKLVFTKIAEIIKVSFQGTLSPLKK
ncbi:YceI family protein [Pedobacter montanisoli]|uniref:YceI family protein n=1 Tax=Pedobacter montanisoli TaxID=2923277 RepID=A0ABS9ZUV3_9SPHI|nr:YceI family protein [Pedobacter montanisoli]MCJ0742182.1 YceI family protein [Pedobacter montanisoli]